MEKKKLSFSLQSKIMGLIMILILIIILVLGSLFAHFESIQIEEHIAQISLQGAKTLSFMTTVKDAFQLEQPEEVLQPLAEKVREDIGADFVIISNKDQIRYSHPDKEQIGKKMVAEDNYTALVFGGYYTKQAEGIMGPSLRGKAPIYSNDNRRIIGVVTVGYLIEHIDQEVMRSVIKVIVFSSFVLFIGIFGSILLARSIRKDTLGLEPHEIASLYRERNAILSSIKEGIIAIDKDGLITMMNKSARRMLKIKDNYLQQRIGEVIPEIDMLSVLRTGEQMDNQEITISGKVFIINCTPVLEKKKKNKIVGVVSSLRDKTELKSVIDTLSEVKQYSEGLRAQTHEYTNKLYVLSGLLQLESYDEAIALIQQESEIHKNQNKILFEQIKDMKLQVIILGKISRASEEKVNFIIDSNSSIDFIPDHISISQLITIVGNLIDNAFEAVAGNDEKIITFFAIDMGEDLIIEVSDNGHGIMEEHFKEVFEKGFSTKGNHDRGYGLANVKETVEDLDGTIHVENNKDGGAIFTVYIPTEKRDWRRNDD